MKVRIFSIYQQDISILEGEINQWLVDNPDIQIRQMLQTESAGNLGWDLVITILYVEISKSDSTSPVSA